MVVENVNIYDLIPTQITEMIQKLNHALEIVKSRKQTISKTASFEKDKITCPHCHRLKIVKNGHTKLGVQTYKCKDCNKRFNDLTLTIFSNSHLTYEQIEIFLQCFKDKVTLRKTAKRMNVDKNTVHLLRLKIINSFQEARQTIKLSGEVEADEIYKSINLKGTKKNKMPRYSKPRTSKGTTARGIGSHKVCIESAIDEFDNMFLEIVGTGPITSDMVKKSLGEKLDNVKKLVTDCKSSYEKLANINSLHSGLATFLSSFRGVSTKHLQSYLDWYTFEKYLNFSFSEEQHSNILLKVVFTNSGNLDTGNMYDNYSGIYFSTVYFDYHFTPSRTN